LTDENRLAAHTVKSYVSTKLALDEFLVNGYADPEMREQLITWAFRLGFALVAALSLYILLVRA
jgi:hypothetical protein